MSDAAYAIALDPAGVTSSGLRATIAGARAEGWYDRPQRAFSCTAMDSKRLLRFYKLASDFFREQQDELYAEICREACDVITLARQRAGL